MADCIEKLVHARIGDYVLVREVGRGTHYSLFQAVDPRVGRMVLLKILHISTAQSSDAAAHGAGRESAEVLEARLEREARALAHLSHPNILTIYETGEHDGFPFLVMEYLYGHPLRQILDQESLSLEEAVGILEQLADAVDAVHTQGILHRDIRPSNVMILHDGRLKLVDFGLARQPGDTTVTLMGELVGEPAYMAPEQLHNKPASPSSDLWALGVLLYEILAGQPPFQGANFTMVAHQVLMGQPAPVPGISPAIQSVVDRALEKDPEKRYRRAGDMVTALRQAIAASPAPPREPRSRPTARPSFITTPTAWFGAGALGMAACVAVAICVSHSSSGTPTAAAATLPAPALASPSLIPPPGTLAPVSYRPGFSPFTGTPPPPNFNPVKAMAIIDRRSHEKSSLSQSGSAVPMRPNTETPVTSPGLK